MENNILNTKNELQALNNCLNYYNLTGYKIHEYFQQDKRRTKQMYFLTDEKGVSLTGHWEYLELNHFISGYGKAFNKFNSLHDAVVTLLKVCTQSGKFYNDNIKAINYAIAAIEKAEQ